MFPEAPSSAQAHPKSTPTTSVISIPVTNFKTSIDSPIGCKACCALIAETLKVKLLDITETPVGKHSEEDFELVFDVTRQEAVQLFLNQSTEEIRTLVSNEIATYLIQGGLSDELLALPQIQYLRKYFITYKRDISQSNDHFKAQCQRICKDDVIYFTYVQTMLARQAPLRFFLDGYGSYPALAILLQQQFAIWYYPKNVNTITLAYSYNPKDTTACKRRHLLRKNNGDIHILTMKYQLAGHDQVFELSPIHSQPRPIANNTTNMDVELQTRLAC